MLDVALGDALFFRETCRTGRGASSNRQHTDFHAFASFL